MSAEPLYRLVDAGFGYDGRAVVEHVTLDVARGEFTALLGPNGAGQSTLMRGMLGLAACLAGRVEYGFDRTRNPPGYVPQKDTLDDIFPVSVLEVVLMGTHARLSAWRRAGRAQRRIAEEALDAVGLADRAGARFWNLSGGQKQRVLIARALASEPEVLLLDEPTAGVDPGAAAAIMDVVARLNRERGLTVVLVSHHLRHVRSLVESVVWVDGGRAEKGTTEAMLAPERLDDLFGLGAQIA
jgi:ABC-type Mn2+/Zn2+ transport system ATPase subunit